MMTHATVLQTAGDVIGYAGHAARPMAAEAAGRSMGRPPRQANPARGGQPKLMRALVVEKPGAVPQVQTLPVPVPGRGEVLVQVAASPINPSDALMVSGDYGSAPVYPFVPGLEGSGGVVASGGGLLARSILGKRVACAPEQGGLWAEYAVVPANRCVPLPKAVSTEAGAMSFVNPLAAIGLLEEATRGGHRSVVSTAAGGALGRMIRERARQKGITVINVVRRAGQAQALREAGAAHVLANESPTFESDLRVLCAQLGCRMAFDAVAGEMTGILAAALEPNGEVLVYGELSGQPAALSPATMTFKEQSVRGFWLTQWSARQSFLRQLLLTRQIMGALSGGFAETRVAGRVGLADAAAPTVLRASGSGAGKVLVVPG